MSWFKILILVMVGLGIINNLIKTRPGYEAETHSPVIYAMDAILDTLMFLGVWFLL